MFVRIIPYLYTRQRWSRFFREWSLQNYHKSVFISPNWSLTLSIMRLVVQVFDLKWVIWIQFCILDLKFPSRPALLDLAHLKITLLTKESFFRGYLTLRIFCSIFFAWNSILIIERPIIHKFSLIGVVDTNFCSQGTQILLLLFW